MPLPSSRSDFGVGQLRDDLRIRSTHPAAKSGGQNDDPLPDNN